MKANISNNSKIVKILEEKFNKTIVAVSEGVDEDCIYFADDTSVSCIIEFTFDKEIQVCVTLLNENFEFVDKIEITY